MYYGSRVNLLKVLYLFNFVVFPKNNISILTRQNISQIFEEYVYRGLSKKGHTQKYPVPIKVYIHIDCFVQVFILITIFEQ